MARATSLFLLLLTGLSDIGGLSVRATLDESAEHVGCYPTTAGEYKVEDALSWKQCLHLCDHRLMNYAGIQAEQNDTTFVLCWCMNVLLKSTEMNSSFCDACADTPNQFCGGNNHSFSVYKLAEKRPLTLLVATSSTLEEWREKVFIIAKDQDNVREFDFHYEKNAVFFLSSDYIFQSYYSSFQMKYAEPKIFKRDGREGSSDINGVSVDWINNKIYFPYYLCCHETGLYSTDLYGQNQERLPLNDRNARIKSISFDVSRRLMFYILENTLYCYNFESKDLKTYHTGTINLKTLLKVAVDTVQQEIFIIGAENDNQYYFIKFNYNDNKRKVLFHGPQMSDPKTFDVFSDNVVWFNYEQDLYFLYECKLTPRCLKENLKRSISHNMRVNDVKIYHPPVQVHKDPCTTTTCSHNCTSTSQGGVKCTCPVNLVLGADNRTCQEKPRSLANMTYLGCYRQNKDYIVLHSLSWEECIRFCDQRRTVYAAIQAEPNAPSFNFPFCFNNLHQDLSAVNSSLCHQCEETTGRFCGGDKVMSVYKLREFSPLTVLLATGSGLRVYSNDTHTVTDIFSTQEHVTSIDYYLSDDKIFFKSEDGVWRTYYSPSLQTYVSALRIHSILQNSSMAVDWINKKLVFTENNHIFESDLKGDTKYDILELPYYPQDLVMDPFNRRVFYLGDSALHSFDFETSVKKTYENENFHVLSVLTISVNVQQEIIYMIGKQNSAIFRLIQTDYAGERGRELYRGAELSAPKALSVWGQQAVWVSVQDSLYTLFSCKLSPRCLSGDLRTLSRSSLEIYAIKIYSVDLQTKTKDPTVVCDELGCSRPNSSKPTLGPSTVNVPVDTYQTTTALLEKPIAENPQIRVLDSPLTDHGQTSLNPLPNWIPRPENVSHAVSTAVHLENTSLTDGEKEESKVQKEYMSFFSVFMIVLGILAVTILLSGFYFITRLQKTNGQLGPISKPVSEMELTNTIPLE